MPTFPDGRESAARLAVPPPEVRWAGVRSCLGGPNDDTGDRLIRPALARQLPGQGGCPPAGPSPGARTVSRPLALPGGPAPVPRTPAGRTAHPANVQQGRLTATFRPRRP